MRRRSISWVLILSLFATLVVPGTSLAITNTCCTIVWEGILANPNAGEDAIKARITLTGVVGEQASAGKVKTYDQVYSSEHGPQYIIPIVDGGSIKVERLGADASKYEDTEETMGLTVIGQIEPLYNDKFYVNDGDYIDNPEFYVNPEFKHYVDKDHPLNYSDLSYSHLTNPNYAAQISLPIKGSNSHSQTFIRIVSQSQAEEMLQEIKDGHPTRLIGKTFNETKPANDKWKPVFPTINKAALEKEYGFKISVAKGFFTEQQALSMISEVYGTFPKGLIKEITSYYKSKGRQTHLNFVYKDTNLGGSFSDKGNNITLTFYPNPISFGDWAIAHEMGHYVHKYINDVYGYNKLQSEWIGLNKKIPYKSKWTDADPDYFVREYGKGSYGEDVATLFELLASRNNSELRTQYLQSPKTPLLKKIDLLNKALSKSSKSVKSLDKIWGTLYPQSPSRKTANEVNKAKENGIIPEDARFSAIYQSEITREDFALLAVNFIQKTTGMTIAAYAEQQGVKKDWYMYGTISGSGQASTKSNYPFADISDSDIFDLHTLGVMDGVQDKIFNPTGYVTREQAVAIVRQLAIALNHDVTAGTIGFADAPKSLISYEQAYMMLNRLFSTLG